MEAHQCVQKIRTGSGYADLSIQMQKQGKKKNNNKAHDNFFGIDWTIIRDSERDHDVDGSIVSCPDITIHDNELTNNQSYNRAEKRLSGQFLVLALEMDGWIEMLSVFQKFTSVVSLTYVIRLFQRV